MSRLRELHEAFRREDAEARTARRDAMLRRAAGEPNARRECTKAIRHDAKNNGTCRWCGAKCDWPIPRPAPPYSMNQGDVLKDEAYRYHWGNDDVDLPGWYQRAGQIYAGWDL